MCLTNISSPRTATRPILVWKVIHRDDTTKEYYSKYQYYPYVKGVPQPVIDIRPKFEEIEQAYHSYHSLVSALWNRSSGYHIGIFTIPKGATYYKGENHDDSKGFASSSITFEGGLTLTNYLKALWKTIITK